MNGRPSPRFVLGAALIALVVLVVVVGRFASHGHPAPLAIANAPNTIAASQSDQAGSTPRGGTSTPSDPLLHAPTKPSTPPGASPPIEVAKSFALAWLHHEGVSAQAWLDGMAPFTSADLRTQLDGVDPDSVPANRLTTAVSIDNDTATGCLARVPTDGGTLKLSLQLSSGKWLVTNIDWDQS